MPINKYKSLTRIGKSFSHKELGLIRELRGFANNEPRDSRELLPFYIEANSNRPGRPYGKGAFARYWLRLEFEGLKKLLKSSPLIRERRAKAADGLLCFLDRLAELEDDSLEQLFNFQDASDGKRSAARYKKRTNIEDLRVKYVWYGKRAEFRRMIQLEEKGKQLEFIEDNLARIKGFDPREEDSFFHELADIPPSEKRRLIGRLKEIRRHGILRAKIYQYIRGKMKSREDTAKLRDIHRRFTIRGADLNPILKILAAEKLVILDEKKRTVKVNSFDPKNKKRFKWLGESGWSLSPFEPYLEKRKIYRAREFREDVLEGWVKAGDALLLII